MKRVIVIEQFKGCRDGQSVVETFEKGDEIEGELAEVALEQKWAKPVRAGKSKVSDAEAAAKAEAEAEAVAVAKAEAEAAAKAEADEDSQNTGGDA